MLWAGALMMPGLSAESVHRVCPSLTHLLKWSSTYPMVDPDLTLRKTALRMNPYSIRFDLSLNPHPHNHCILKV